MAATAAALQAEPVKVTQRRGQRLKAEEKPLPSLGQRLTYSVQEAVKLTGLHKITIHRAIADGKLRSRLVGRRRLIDARSLHQYVGVENETP